MEVRENKLHVKDENTNALIPLVALSDSISEDDKIVVQENKLYKVDEETNALVPILTGISAGGEMMTPDYANMETDNRITAVGGSWTADRSGFVKIHGIGKEGTGTDSFRININEELVSINRTQAQDGTATSAKMLIHSEILPIAKGDVISIPSAYNNSLGCYFIPPKFIKKEFPTIIEKNGSYSLDEVKTAETWIDGKPIYKKSVNVNNATSWAAGQVNLGVTIPDIDIVIDYIMVVRSSDTTLYKSNTYANVRELRMGVNSSGVLVGYMPATIGGMVANTMICTVLYTKTTD